MKYFVVMVIVVVVSYSFGRYMAPEKVRTEIQTVTVEVEKKVNKKQKVYIRENTDGSKETVIVTDTTTDERSKGAQRTDSKEVVSSKDKLNVSILAGSSLSLQPIVGASAHKNFIGPITLGVWGLSNGTGGLSVGLNF